MMYQPSVTFATHVTAGRHMPYPIQRSHVPTASTTIAETTADIDTEATHPSDRQQQPRQGPRLGRIRPTAAAMVTLTVLVVGCGGPRVASPAATAPHRPGTSAPAVSGRSSPSLPSRSASGVLAALRRIDPCQLFDPNAVASAGLKAAGQAPQPLPVSPHTCEDPGLAVAGQLHAEVNLGVNFGPQAAAHQLTRVALDGVLAEVTGSAGVMSPATCVVYLPVDLDTDQAIAVQVVAGEAPIDSCAVARTLATGAVAQLTNPAAPRATSSLPLAGWDACSALAALFGGSRLAPELSLDGCLDLAAPAQPSVTFAYDRAPGPTGATFNAQPIAVGPVQGWAEDTFSVAGVPDGCSVSWSRGPSGQPGPRSDVVIVDSDQTCAQAAGDGMKLQTILRSTAPGGPQPPLLLYSGSA